MLPLPVAQSGTQCSSLTPSPRSGPRGYAALLPSMLQLPAPPHPVPSFGPSFGTQPESAPPPPQPPNLEDPPPRFLRPAACSPGGSPGCDSRLNRSFTPETRSERPPCLRALRGGRRRGRETQSPRRGHHPRRDGGTSLRSSRLSPPRFLNSALYFQATSNFIPSFKIHLRVPSEEYQLKIEAGALCPALGAGGGGARKRGAKLPGPGGPTARPRPRGEAASGCQMRTNPARKGLGTTSTPRTADG